MPYPLPAPPEESLSVILVTLEPFVRAGAALAAGPARCRQPAGSG